MNFNNRNDDSSSSDVDVNDINHTSFNNNNQNQNQSSINQFSLELFPQLLSLDIKNNIIKYLTNVGVDQSITQSLNNQLEEIIEKEYKDKEKEKENNQFIESNHFLLAKLNSLYNVTNNQRINKGRKRFKKSLNPNITPIVPFDKLNEIQITASKDEIDKRIKSYINRKKLENSEFNSTEFRKLEDKNNQSARTSTVLPLKIKTLTTINTEGPSTTIVQESSTTPCINDRCKLIEQHIGLISTPLEIYNRVKVIEDKIVEIEQKNPTFFKELYESRQKQQRSNVTIEHQSKLK